MMSRIEKTFSRLQSENRAALVTFITAGDPDLETSQALLNALPEAGADIIELGMPFSDPTADGAAIQAANLRAFANGINLKKVLGMVTAFRTHNQTTPIILMGYANSIEAYGAPKFIDDASSAGVDGLILVDLPFEEDDDLRALAAPKNIAIIRLATPTTDEQRLKTILTGSSGFLYYVSVRGITGQNAASSASVDQAYQFLKSHTKLPVAIGFGIRTAEQAADIARIADGVVVGSVLVELCGGPDPRQALPQKVRELASAVHSARQ